MVGRLIYLSHIKLDIISVVSQFMHKVNEELLQAVQRILQCLKATFGRGILFKKGEELTIEAYSDANYTGSMVTRRSTIGYCAFIIGNLVT